MKHLINAIVHMVRLCFVKCIDCISLFFFSSRRRHTRLQGDWSSDVCSSDLAGRETKVIDLKGRRVLPGLIDNHLHIIRGGLNFNMELRWDGVRSLADAMAMLKRQVAITPPPQWVRVIGGFTGHQFAEKRLPTLEEINSIAPATPVFLLHPYD